MLANIITNIFDQEIWANVPFHFWSVVFFVLGSMVGSFLNVCIYRMPREESVVSPPSHCPHCKYSIPWYLNVPILTWIILRGKCRNCGAPISVRYLLVELLTGCVFLICWLGFGHDSAAVALTYSLMLAGLITASAIDFEHFIIPDEITLGGIGVGFILSLLVPSLHGAQTIPGSLEQSILGIATGAGLLYGILRLGKLLYGRQRFDLPSGTRVYFGENGVRLPDREIPYDEIFYRDSDAIRLQARTVEMADRCYANVPVRLSPSRLLVGEDEFKPEQTHHLEVLTDEIVLPREAMGLGDVKFMAAIGAFIGWQGVVFSLMVSAMIGAAIGVSLIAARRGEWSSRLPYGPYIALAAVLWIFAGDSILKWWIGPLPG